MNKIFLLFNSICLVFILTKIADMEIILENPNTLSVSVEILKKLTLVKKLPFQGVILKKFLAFRPYVGNSQRIRIFPTLDSLVVGSKTSTIQGIYLIASRELEVYTKPSSLPSSFQLVYMEVFAYGVGYGVILGVLLVRSYSATLREILRRKELGLTLTKEELLFLLYIVFQCLCSIFKVRLVTLRLCIGIYSWYVYMGTAHNFYGTKSHWSLLEKGLRLFKTILKKL